MYHIRSVASFIASDIINQHQQRRTPLPPAMQRSNVFCRLRLSVMLYISKALALTVFIFLLRRYTSLEW